MPFGLDAVVSPLTAARHAGLTRAIAAPRTDDAMREHEHPLVGGGAHGRRRRQQHRRLRRHLVPHLLAIDARGRLAVAGRIVLPRGRRPPRGAGLSARGAALLLVRPPARLPTILPDADL